VLTIFLLAAIASGAWSFLNRKFDTERREEALLADGGWWIDLSAYRWILANTRADDTFATPLELPWSDPAALAAYTAGRKLVALPSLHSNPYVPWEPRDERRRQILEAAAGVGPPTPLCHGGVLWVVLPINTTVDESRVEAAYSTGRRIIYRVRSGVC